MLMILTDGDINDKDTTKQLVKDAENLPISILVVKIGSNSIQEDASRRQDYGETNGDKKMDEIKDYLEKYYTPVDENDIRRNVFRCINYNEFKSS